MPQRGKGIQPKVGERASLPWVDVFGKSRYPERGCGTQRATAGLKAGTPLVFVSNGGLAFA